MQTACNYDKRGAHPFEDDTDDVVGILVKDIENKILIVQGMGGKWSFPKGRRKRGETPYEGAIREGYEESGIDVENCIYLGTCDIGFGTYFEYKFRGLGEHLFLKPKQLGEIKGVSWKFPGSYYMRKECLMNNDLGMYVRKINSIWRASLRKE